MFALAIRSDRMSNPLYEVEAAQPMMGKYVVLLLKEGQVVSKYSSYEKSEIFKKIKELAESKHPENLMPGA